MILSIVLLSIAEASPTEGFRGTVCVGLASACPIVQVGMAYVNNRFGVNIGGAPLPRGLNVGLRYYISETELDNRVFMGSSAGRSINGVYDMAAVGVHVGLDSHLFDDRMTILTSRVGLDYMNSSGQMTFKDGSVKPTFVAEISRCF